MGATGGDRSGAVPVIETAHGPIECASVGAGPAVLMLHGTPGGSDQGLALARVLALGGYRVVSPSRPGYLGTRLAVGAAFEAQADACAALLDALGIGRAVVIANSGGGVVATQFALRHPGRAARLILLQSITARLAISADDLLRAALLLPRSARLAPAVAALAARRRDPALVRAALDLARSTLPVAARRGGVINDSMRIATLPAYPLGSIAAAAAIPAARLLTVPGGTHSSTLFDLGALRAVRAFLRQS